MADAPALEASTLANACCIAAARGVGVYNLSTIRQTLQVGTRATLTAE